MRLCAQPGCRTVVDAGRCPTHHKQRDRQRGSAQERGYDYAWSLYSKSWLARHPVCGMRMDGTLDTTHSRCVQQGLTTPAQCVDHTVPMAQGGSKWDPLNHMSACLACNSWKANTIDARALTKMA